jgi:hypothetical protein
MRKNTSRAVAFLLAWQLTAGALCASAQTSSPGQQPAGNPAGEKSPVTPPANPTQPGTGNTPPTTDGGGNTSGGNSTGSDDNKGGQDYGITVGRPKQFDERTLTLMLQSLEEKLARSQFPDPAGLYAGVGRFGGATATTTSLGVSVRGPAAPSVATTVGGTTESGSTTSNTVGSTVGTTNTTNVAPTGTTTSVGATTGGTTTNTGGTTSGTSNTFEQQTTQPGLAPPTPPLPGQTSLFSYQPQFGVSSQDLLSEQTALFYQIVNLRLLLDRSLSDRINEKQDGTPTREQVVIGFQISIDAAHKDAVAEAEITVAGQGVSLVSLLPRDKTYNVASVTKDSKAVDVGAVVQFVGVGVAAGKTQESLYLVKDTDTVALERPATGSNIKFAWQFRPVLGRRTVEPGMRQVYALVSVPKGGSAARELKVTATTKWRRYDRKTKSVGGLTSGITPHKQYGPESLHMSDPYTAEHYLKPFISNVRWNDTGNGQVLAVVEGEGFTPDTSLVLGNTVLNRPENGLTVANERRMIVVAPAQLLARSLPTLVGRYGTAEFTRSVCMKYERAAATAAPASPAPAATPTPAPRPAALGGDFDSAKCPDSMEKMFEPYSGLELGRPVITARDASTSEVTVTLKVKSGSPDRDFRYLFKYHQPVVLLGGRVFGLSDAPFISTSYEPAAGDTHKSVSLTFVAPTSLVVSSRTLVVKEFLWNIGALEIDYKEENVFNATGVTTLGANSKKLQLAIAGGGFSKDVRVMVGDVSYAVDCNKESGCVPGLKLHPAGAEDGTATMITLSPTKAETEDVKYILVFQGKAQPQALTLTQPAPPVPTAKITSPSGPLPVNKGDSRQVEFKGENFDSIKKVIFEGKELSGRLKPDDKTVFLVDLQTFVTSETGTKEIIFVMKDDKEVRFPFHVRP